MVTELEARPAMPAAPVRKMGKGELLVRIRVLEDALQALTKEVAERGLDDSPLAPADLYGIVGGQLDLSEEEIDAFKYRFEWEGEEMR